MISFSRKHFRVWVVVIQLLVITLQPLLATAQNVTAFADLLHWQASQETSSSWATTISSGTRTGSKDYNIDSNNIRFNYTSGFRGGFIYQSADQYWGSKLYWTYFRTTASNNLRVASQIVAPEFFSGFISGNFFFGGDINWKILLNTVDWDLGHTMEFGDFRIRPSIGIKGGIINQSIDSSWDAVIYKSTELVKHKFSGVGPSFGIDTTWDIYCSDNNTVSLVGDFIAAFMWGRWNVTDTYIRPMADSGLITPTTIITSMHHTNLGTPMFQFLLGLQWEYEQKYIFSNSKGKFNESTYKFGVKLGYEMQYWINQLRLTTFQQLPTHGDLILQGGTCGIYIEL